MGIKHQDGTTKTNVITQLYPLAPANVVYTAAKGAFGVAAIDTPQNTTLNLQLPGQFPTLFYNFWYQTPLIGAGATTILQAFDSVGNAIQLQFQISTAGTLQLLRNATLIATYATPLAPNTLYHFEIKLTIDPSVGLCQVRINGNTTPAINFSGNTRTSANSFTDQVRFGPTANAASYHNYYSHLVIFDNTGAAPNDWIGVKRIYTQLLTADSASGGLNAFATAPSQAPGAHFNNVKETPPDDDATYNSDSAPGDRESYRVAGLPATLSNIIAVTEFVRMKIDDAGPHQVALVARNGSSDTVGASQSLAGGYLYYSEVFPRDPNTGADWTPAGFGTGANSNAEFGLQIVT